MGMPTSYTEEMAQRVCEAVRASQQGLRGTLKADSSLPSVEIVMRWMDQYASFRSNYTLAKNDQLRLMAEDIIDIAKDDSLDVNDRRLPVDTRKWLLSKLIPKTYGDKLDVTSGGEAMAAPSHQIDARIQSIIMQAQKRKAGGDTLQLEALSHEARALLD